MYVRKVRGQDKVGKIVITAFQAAVVRKMGLTLEKYVKQQLLIIAKKRRWKWYLNREKT
jgi:predicted choloylglycine hydrolase